MATWLRTQNNGVNEQLVNLDNVENILMATHGDTYGIFAEFPNGRVLLTYFDGPDAERLCQYALDALLDALGGKYTGNMRHIDMASVCEDALARAEDEK